MYGRHNSDSDATNANSGEMATDREIAAFNAATLVFEAPPTVPVLLELPPMVVFG